jgi:lipoate-protein ligase B
LNSLFFAFRPNYSYEEALRFQGILNAEEYTGLLAFEPPETVTLGRLADEETDLLVSPSFLQQRGVRILSTDRGGKATYHGPGQLVGFPIVSLNRLYGDPRAVKRFTEELLLGLAHACAILGVKSVETRSDFPGLWTSRGKLASIGISVKDGYVFHGFSLNVHATAVQGFGSIVPCGIQNCPITSLEQEGVRVESVQEVASKILPYLTVVQGADVLSRSKTVSYENSYTNMLSAVSRSPMAIEHFQSNLENFEK